MKGKLSVVGMTILLVALMVSSTQAFTIFFWRHDNNLAVIDPVYNASMTATASLTRALDSLGLEYTINSNLPSADQLCEYDVMMTSLSFLCPG
jgi:hypothetical protein